MFNVSNSNSITGVYVTGGFCGWANPGSGTSWTSTAVSLPYNNSRYEVTGLLTKFKTNDGIKFIVTYSDENYSWMGAKDLKTSIPASYYTSADGNFLLNEY